VLLDDSTEDSGSMSQEDRTLLGWGAFVIAAAALFVSIFAVLRDDGAAVAQPEAPSATVTVLEVVLSDFKIEPAAILVPTGPVKLQVRNAGATVHNFVVPGLNARTPDLQPGASYELDLGTLAEGTYDTLCDIAGHAGSGMVGTMSVRADAMPTMGGSSGHGKGNWQETDYLMEERHKTFPAKTEGRGGQPIEPVILDDGTKLFRITTSYVDWEVEPGKVVRAMAYNGTVPGPEIRVDVGDKVRVELTNELDQSTALHFHGIRVPNPFDGVSPYTQPVIQPGQTYTYEFTTVEPAVGIYHSHHMAEIQIPDGLFGAFMVGQMEIPQAMIDKGFTQVDHEVTMVLNDAGAIGMSLNGKSFPATEAYTMAVGEVMMVHYQNEGLMGHPMHLHQPVGWIVAKDGIPLEVPMPGDTIWVSPGERYTVLYKAVDPGVWAWHCHILTHAEGPQGMYGMVTALIVTP
jgi:manganese oxidase